MKTSVFLTRCLSNVWLDQQFGLLGYGLANRRMRVSQRFIPMPHSRSRQRFPLSS